MADKAKLYCSFCGKSHDEVRKLIAGPTVFICDECVALCHDIIQEGIWEKRLRERLTQEGYAIVPSKLLKGEEPTPIPARTSLDKFISYHKRG